MTSMAKPPPHLVDRGSEVTEDRGPADLLGKLLGYETDAYIDEHAAKYQLDTTRWRECDMATWIAGADGMSEQIFMGYLATNTGKPSNNHTEIAAKYNNILEFVCGLRQSTSSFLIVPCSRSNFA